MKITKTKLKKLISEELRAFGTINEEIDSGASYGPVNLVKKQRDRPDLLPNAVQDPHVGGYNADPAANINNIQVASRILEDLPLEELPEVVSDAAFLLRQALDELYEKNTDVGFGEPSDTEPPHFRPEKG